MRSTVFRPLIPAAGGAAAAFYGLPHAPLWLCAAAGGILLCAICLCRVLEGIKNQEGGRFPHFSFKGAPLLSAPPGLRPAPAPSRVSPGPRSTRAPSCATPQAAPPPEACRLFREWGIAACALTLGVMLGAAARLSAPGPFWAGLPLDAVTAVEGRLLDDPRLLAGGQGIAPLSVRGAASGGVRARVGGRARQSVSIMFSPEAHETLRDYGRGCHVYAEGVMVQGKQGLLFRAAAVHAAQRASPLERFRTRLRLALLEKFRGPVWGGLGQALLLGARDDLDAGLSAAFRDAGCSHILALSGMHLALLSGLLAFLLKRPLGLKGAALAGGIFVIFYVFLAGAQASLVRSALMYMVGALSLWACLKVNVKLSLALSFLAQITIWSGEGLSLSFILSYLALAGILWIGGLAAPLLRGKLPPFLASGAAASVGAFLASAAVTAFCFGALRPIGLAAGLVLAPLAELFMVLALAALALSFSLPALLYPLDKALSLLYRLLEYLTRAAARAPGLVTGSAWPVLAASIAACLALWLLCRRKEAQLQRMGPFG